MNTKNIREIAREKFSAMPSQLKIGNAMVSNPYNIPSRPPIIQNKERGTMSSAIRMSAPKLYL